MELHFTGLGPGLETFADRICFAIDSPGLLDIDPDSRQGQSPETIKKILYDALDAQRDRLRGVIDREVKSASGCAVAGLLLLGSMLATVLAIGTLL